MYYLFNIYNKKTYEARHQHTIRGKEIEGNRKRDIRRVEYRYSNIICLRQMEMQYTAGIIQSGKSFAM